MPAFFEDIAANQETRIGEYGIAFCDGRHRFGDDSFAYYREVQQRSC
jgi:hypothetical protein